MTEKILKKIKSLLWVVKLIKKENELEPILAARKDVQELLSDPCYSSEVLKDIYDRVMKSSTGFHLACNLPDNIQWEKVYNFPNYDVYKEGITLYDLVRFTGQEPAIFCLENPNFPDVLEVLKYNVQEWLFDREELWNGKPLGQTVKQRLQIAAIKAILGNPVLPLEILENLPEPFLDEDMRFTNTNYQTKEEYIENSSMTNTLFRYLSQEESDKLRMLL